MKKHLIKSGLSIFLIAIGMSITSFSNSTRIEREISVEKLSDCHYGQCQATAKSTGERCRHCVSNEGDRFCWQHK